MDLKRSITVRDKDDSYTLFINDKSTLEFRDNGNGRAVAYFANEQEAQKFVDKMNKKESDDIGFYGLKHDGVRCVGSQYAMVDDVPHVCDNINHPSHYTNHPSGVECIDITEHFNFCLGNAIKYIWRAGLKENEEKTNDLQKAIWYLNREIESAAKFRRSADVKNKSVQY